MAGTGGILLVAKQERLVDLVRPLLEALIETGYYLSPSLREEVLRLAGEQP